MELKINKIEEKTINTKDVIDETVYRMQLSHAKNAFPKVVITQQEPFKGYKPGDLVKLTVHTDQKTLVDETYGKENTYTARSPTPKPKTKKAVNKKATTKKK